MHNKSGIKLADTERAKAFIKGDLLGQWGEKDGNRVITVPSNQITEGHIAAVNDILPACDIKRADDAVTFSVSAALYDRTVNNLTGAGIGEVD